MHTAEPNLRQTAADVFQAILKGRAEEYTCSICLSLVVEATTVCDEEHVFCWTCLEKSLTHKKECPCCRQTATQPRRLRHLNNQVEEIAPLVLDEPRMAERMEKVARAKLRRNELAHDKKQSVSSSVNAFAGQAASSRDEGQSKEAWEASRLGNPRSKAELGSSTAFSGAFSKHEDITNRAVEEAKQQETRVSQPRH